MRRSVSILLLPHAKHAHTVLLLCLLLCYLLARPERLCT